VVERVQHRIDGPRADLVTALDELDELAHDGARLGHAGIVAFDRQPVPAQVDRAVEPVAQRAQHAVADARELGCGFVRDFENFLHSRSVGMRTLVLGASRRAPRSLLKPNRGTEAHFATAAVRSTVARPSRRLLRGLPLRL